MRFRWVAREHRIRLFVPYLSIYTTVPPHTHTRHMSRIKYVVDMLTSYHQFIFPFGSVCRWNSWCFFLSFFFCSVRWCSVILQERQDLISIVGTQDTTLVTKYYWLEQRKKPKSFLIFKWRCALDETHYTHFEYGDYVLVCAPEDRDTHTLRIIILVNPWAYLDNVCSQSKENFLWVSFSRSVVLNRTSVQYSVGVGPKDLLIYWCAYCVCECVWLIHFVFVYSVHNIESHSHRQR